jgi:hypothetical protein
MQHYVDYVSENRRCCILRLLEAQSEYSANESVLQMALQQFGFSESRDKVRTDLHWLAEQELLETHIVGEHIVVAKLTTRGVDVAKGRTVVPGVQRPNP